MGQEWKQDRIVLAPVLILLASPGAVTSKSAANTSETIVSMGRKQTEKQEKQEKLQQQREQKRTAA